MPLCLLVSCSSTFPPLFVYAAVFLFVCHLFVVWHEEPALRQAFEREYEDYCSHVKRWGPTV